MKTAVKHRTAYIIIAVVLGLLWGHFLYANFINSGPYHLRTNNAAHQSFIAEKNRANGYDDVTKNNHGRVMDDLYKDLQVADEQHQRRCDMGDCTLEGSLLACNDSDILSEDLLPCYTFIVPVDKGFPFATNGNYFRDKNNLKSYSNENFRSAYVLNTLYGAVVISLLLGVLLALRPALKNPK